MAKIGIDNQRLGLAQGATPRESLLTREIRKHALAESDLIGIWKYTFHEWDAAQADKYLDELDEGIKDRHASRQACPRESSKFVLPGAPTSIGPARSTKVLPRGDLSDDRPYPLQKNLPETSESSRFLKSASG